MKKTIYILVSIVFLVLVALLVSNKREIGNNTVGVVLPLTGKFAAISEDIQNSIILAQEQAGNKSVEIVFEDSAGEPQKAVSAITNLITNHRAKLILSGTGSTANIAMSKIAEQNRVPLFAITSTPELMGKNDFTFTLQPSVIREVDSLTAFVSKQGYKKIAILYDGTSDSLTAGASHFKDNMLSKGNDVLVYESYVEHNDQNTTNLKIKSSNPDLVYILGVDKAVGPIVKKLREIGYAGDIAGFSGIESAVFLSASGKASEGTYLTSLPFSCDNEEAKEYCSAYKLRFNGRVPQQYGAYMYSLVYRLLKEGNCMTFLCLTSNQYKDSVAGIFKFDQNGDIDQSVSIVIKKVEGSKFQLLQ